MRDTGSFAFARQAIEYSTINRMLATAGSPQ
jgi:hypothetical protein